MRLFAITLVLASLVVGSAAARCSVPAASYTRVGDAEVSTTSPSFLLGIDRDDTHGGVEPAPSTLRLAGPRPITLALDTIAPGLLRASASRALSPGAHTVEGLRVPLTVQAAAIPAPPAFSAPVVASMSFALRRHSTTIIAALTSQPPDAVVAFVLSRQGRPVAWRPRALVDTTSFTVAVTGCTPTADGYEVPPPGASVTLQFVDAAGNLSPPSNAVVVE